MCISDAHYESAEIRIDRLQRRVDRQAQQLAEARKLLWLLLPHANVLTTERAQALDWLHQAEWTTEPSCSK